MSYRTDMEPVYKPEFRSGIERQGLRYFVVQRYIDSPHVLVWQSTPFPSADGARRWLLEQHAMLALDEGRHPLMVCSNLSSIAFNIHWSDSSLHHSADRGPLGDCVDCYEAARDLVRAAAEELDWIKEVHLG